MVTSVQALELLELLRAGGVDPWVDGGWGVDALLGEQTREHDDLDLVIPAAAVDRCRQRLTDAGFKVERDWLPTALVLRHPDGLSVDLHPVEPSPDGGGEQIQLDGISRFHYPPPVAGRIGGREVPCCSVQCQIDSHIGYQPDDKDRRDLVLLRDRFGIDLPAPYRQ